MEIEWTRSNDKNIILKKHYFNKTLKNYGKNLTYCILPSKVTRSISTGKIEILHLIH